MELKENKIEFEIEVLAPLLIANKKEGFRQTGEKNLNTILKKEFETFIGTGRHELNEQRKGHSNGHKGRELKTTLEI